MKRALSLATDRWSAPLALATLAVAFLHAALTGQTKTLLNPLLQPMVPAAGAVLLAAAAALLLLGAAPAPSRRNWGAWARALAVAAAVIVAVACAPRSFSSLALANRAVSDPTALLRNKADEAAPRLEGGRRRRDQAGDRRPPHGGRARRHDGAARRKKVRFIGQYAPDDGGNAGGSRSSAS